MVSRALERIRTPSIHENGVAIFPRPQVEIIRQQLIGVELMSSVPSREVSHALQADTCDRSVTKAKITVSGKQNLY